MKEVSAWVAELSVGRRDDVVDELQSGDVCVVGENMVPIRRQPLCIGFGSGMRFLEDGESLIEDRFFCGKVYSKRLNGQLPRITVVLRTVKF